MSFPQEIKEKAFVACARRCCVCKKRAGRNIEVHHIVQKADGGEDSFENAIPLCFDCHADAGHYNPKHPKGSKYSPNELRRHRDLWYQAVGEGRYDSKEVQLTHHYLLTDCFSVVWEIVSGNFSSLPIDSIKLAKNKLFDYLEAASKFQKDFDREKSFIFATYESTEDFIFKHPEAYSHEAAWGVSFLKRNISIEELKEQLLTKDFISNELIRAGAESHDVADVSFLEDSCGGGHEEHATLRKARVVFLSVINRGSECLRCESLIGRYDDVGGIASLDASLLKRATIDMHHLELNPGECLLIPCWIALDRIAGENYEPLDLLIKDTLELDQVQQTRKVLFRNFMTQQTVGPRFMVERLDFSTNEGSHRCEFRPHPSENPLMISRFWEVGCCPHVFLFNEGNGSWSYFGELFSAEPFTEQVANFDLTCLTEKGFSKLKFVELEDEETVLKSLIIDGELVASNLRLEKGDEIVISIVNHINIYVCGSYKTKSHVTYVKDFAHKKKKIRHDLADMNLAVHDSMNL